MSKKIIILGAGAIGRGYLPWVFSQSKDNLFEFIFVDTNPQIIKFMKEVSKYETYRVKNNELEKKTIPIHQAYLASEFVAEEYQNATAVFMNVGPRNVIAAAKLVESLNCPIILSENDPATVNQVKAATKLTKVYFAVPDVITSNSAPSYLLDKDPLSVITEDGALFIDSRCGVSGLDAIYCSEAELMKQWTAKLYLHNTPHCVAAYFGALAKITYLHEAMAIPSIQAIVKGSMQEMLSVLKLNWDIPHKFLDWYAEKELARFSNILLYDPIARVAREPLRKLEAEGRLLGAAQISISLGVIPDNILLGIGAALLFDNSKDNDHHLVFMRKSLSSSALLTHVLGFRSGEALERILSDRFTHIFQKIESIIPKSEKEAITESPLSSFWGHESELALKAVSQGGAIASQQPESFHISQKESARDIVTQIDYQIEDLILKILKGSKYPVLAEESILPQHTNLLDNSEPVWCVDAIDGTANFVSGLPHFAVSAGLLYKQEFVVGAVSLPAFKELYFTYARDSINSYLNGKLLRVKNAKLEESLVGVSFSGCKDNPEFRKLQYEIFGWINDATRGSLRFGSAASNLCAVAAGKLQVVYGFSAQLWDVAGGIAVAQHAGAAVFWKRIPNSTRCHYIVGAPTAAEKMRDLFEQQKWMVL